MTESVLTKLSFGLSISLQILVLVLISRKRLKRRFLWFFAYILYEICESVARFSVFDNTFSVLYNKVYWTTDVADLIFGAIAFCESFLNVFRPYTRFRWFTAIVWICIGSGLLYAAFRIWALPPVTSTHQTLVVLNVAEDYSLGAAGILYLALIVFLQIKEHQWESAVILGFTVYFIFGSGGYLAFSVFGAHYPLVSNWLPFLGFLLGATIWVVGLWRQEPAVAVPVKNLHEKDLELLNRYATIVDLIFKRKR
jgi:hypothetical protein